MMKLESLFSWLLTSTGDKVEHACFSVAKTSLRALLHRMRTQARSCEPQQADGLTTVQKLVEKAHFTTMFVEKASHVRSAVEFEGLRGIAAVLQDATGLDCAGLRDCDDPPAPVSDP
jgi:hypothetical protein